MIEIIAEIGINHNGDLNVAKELVQQAKRAGATCVKFQTFFIEELAREHTPKSEFQLRDKSSTSHTEIPAKNIPRNGNDALQCIRDVRIRHRRSDRERSPPQRTAQP